MKDQGSGNILLNQLKNGKRNKKRKQRNQMSLLLVSEAFRKEFIFKIIFHQIVCLLFYILLDYNQVATKKYKKQINELKPDLAAYNEQKAAAIASSSLIKAEDGQIVPVDTESSFYRDANSLQYASVDNQPNREAIDRVVADVNKTIARREKSSRQKTINDEDDITYINERNRRFNEKIGRFYDKYTKEIKENFERGTAYVLIFKVENNDFCIIFIN